MLLFGKYENGNHESDQFRSAEPADESIYML